MDSLKGDLDSETEDLLALIPQQEDEPAEPYTEPDEIDEAEEEDVVPAEEVPVIGASLPPGFTPPNPFEELRLQMETLKLI